MIDKSQWESMTPYKKYKAVSDSGETLRIAREDTTAFVYAKGKSRRGWRYSPEYVMNTFTLCENTDENEKWQKRLDRALRAMNKSGLWNDYREIFTNLKNVDYYDKEEISKRYWKIWDITRQKLSTEEYNKELNNLFEGYITKYPFIFRKDNAGAMYVDTVYLFEVSECRLKSMYFGRENKRFKEDIKTSLQNKTDYKLPYRVTTSYDLHYRYDSAKSKAWYSEEYIGTGNGHYYIALDENTALFVEND